MLTGRRRFFSFDHWLGATTRLVFDHICDSRLTASVPATKASNDNTRNPLITLLIFSPVLSPEEKVRGHELVTKSFRNDGGPIVESHVR